MYCNENGEAPFLDWFDRLPEKVQDKCTVRIERLEECGHNLRRPEADFLKDGIYELRFKLQAVNYRILYFFHGRKLAVLSHGIAKQSSDVPEKEIKKAIKRKDRFIAKPSKCTYKE